MRASPAARKFGPSQRSPIARSIARAVHGASGVVMVFRDCTVPELLTAARSAGGRGTRAAVLSGDGVVGGEMRGEDPAVEQELIRGGGRLPGAQSEHKVWPVEPIQLTGAVIPAFRMS